MYSSIQWCSNRLHYGLGHARLRRSSENIKELLRIKFPVPAFILSFSLATFFLSFFPHPPFHSAIELLVFSYLIFPFTAASQWNLFTSFIVGISCEKFSICWQITKTALIIRFWTFIHSFIPHLPPLVLSLIPHFFLFGWSLSRENYHIKSPCCCCLRC